MVSAAFRDGGQQDVIVAAFDLRSDLSGTFKIRIQLRTKSVSRTLCVTWQHDYPARRAAGRPYVYASVRFGRTIL